MSQQNRKGQDQTRQDESHRAGETARQQEQSGSTHQGQQGSHQEVQQGGSRSPQKSGQQDDSEDRTQRR